MAKMIILSDEKRYRDLRVLLSGCMDVEEKSPEDVSKALKIKGFSASTLRRRLKNPKDLTLEELSKMGRLLGADIEQLRTSAIRY
jgi:methylphosphotriester-DNA--protein-cysteine methyltransferase